MHLSKAVVKISILVMSICVIAMRAEDVEVSASALQIDKPIYPTVIGGNEVLNLNSRLWQAVDVFKQHGMTKMNWRVHCNDDAYGWRWDTNRIGAPPNNTHTHTHTPHTFGLQTQKQTSSHG